MVLKVVRLKAVEDSGVINFFGRVSCNFLVICIQLLN